MRSKNSNSSTAISLKHVKGTGQRTTAGEHHTWSPNTQQSTRQSYTTGSGSVRSGHKDKFASSTDQITVARHVWQYMIKYNDQEVMQMRRVCKFDIYESDKEALILTATASPPDNIDHFFDNKFIPLYQKISDRVTLQNYSIASLNQQDAEDLAEKLETDYACVAFVETDGRLRVVCQKVEKDRIDRFMGQYSRMPIRKSMDLSSQCHPTGYMAGGVQVFLHVCDITSMAVDAITDPANTGLRAYGGLSKVISTAAGIQFMTNECEKLLRRKGRELAVGEVVHTAGGRLHAKYVLHVAGPMWPKSPTDVTSQQRCMDDLAVTFHNVILSADKLKLDSVAIPPISSGKISTLISMLPFLNRSSMHVGLPKNKTRVCYMNSCQLLYMSMPHLHAAITSLMIYG